MSFTDGKPRLATHEDTIARWSGGPPGERFRCYLCGHRFRVGDVWRWVYNNGRLDAEGKLIESSGPWGNFIVCEHCDGPDVKERWAKHMQLGLARYWFFLSTE